MQYYHFGLNKRWYLMKIKHKSMNLPPPAKKADNNRLHYIDNLRVLACFLVILTHSTMPSNNPEHDGMWMALISLMGSPSSELFLTLSGTVLLPIKTGVRKFYKRRFLKLVPPLIIWSVLGVLLLTRTRGFPMNWALDRIIHIPVAPALLVYWFVYAMIGLYLLAPFISPWLKQTSKKQLELFLALWIINLIIPWIQLFVPNFIPDYSMNGNYYWMLCYFGGFLGYWLLGYYLNNYPVQIGLNKRFVVIFFTSILYPIVLLWLYSKGLFQDQTTDNLQIGSAAWVAMLYVILFHVRFPEKLEMVLTKIAKYSFGIYLTHLYIATELYWGIFEGTHIHIFPRTFLIAILTLITGYLLTWLIGKLPISKYVVGV